MARTKWTPKEYRIFGGKRYELDRFPYTNRAQANQTAQIYRKRGMLTRIIRTKNPAPKILKNFGEWVYWVYTAKK